MNPAEYVISLFGGSRAANRALGLSSATVGYWKKRGYVPMAQISNIMRVCTELKIKVDRTKLFPK